MPGNRTVGRRGTRGGEGGTPLIRRANRPDHITTARNGRRAGEIRWGEPRPIAAPAKRGANAMAEPSAGWSPGLGRQLEIYRGARGEDPRAPVSVEELEPRGQLGAAPGGLRLRGRARTPCVPTSTRSAAIGWCRGISATSPGVTWASTCWARDGPRRSCWRRSACCILHKEVEPRCGAGRRTAGGAVRPEHRLLGPDGAGRRAMGEASPVPALPAAERRADRWSPRHAGFRARSS